MSRDLQHKLLRPQEISKQLSGIIFWPPDIQVLTVSPHRCTTAPKGPQRNGHSCHGNAGELQAHIKQEFRKAAGDEEVYGMKYRLSEGRVQLRQLSETLGMTSA